MKRLIKKIINKKFAFYNKSIYDNHKIHFSQEGEDILLNHILQYKNSGFYVDIGAHHPQKYSNTYLFYLNGWNGINIEALPAAIEKFKQIRKRDLNINTAITEDARDIEFSIFNAKGMSTANPNLAKEYQKNKEYYIENTIKLKSSTLADILNEYMPPNTHIDFMSIDVEGLDLEVLKSNDWDKYIPTWILIEDQQSSIEDCINSEIHAFLNNKEYTFICRTHNTSFYKQKQR